MSRELNWRIEVVRDGLSIGTFKASECELIFDAHADVMRSGKIKAPAIYKTREGDDVNLFSDRFKPVMIHNGNDHPLGRYVVMAAPRSVSDTGSNVAIEMYDETMILKQACTQARTFFASGSSYQTSISALILACGITDYRFDDTALTMSDDHEYAPGTPYIELINGLLDEINYEHVHTNLDGTIQLTAKKAKTTADHIYYDRRPFGLLKPISIDTDIYSRPNVFVGVVSNPSLDAPLVYTKENNDVNSQISIPRRGYRVTKVYDLSNIASQAELQNYIDAEYLKQSQMTETAEIQTIPEPGHEYGDAVQLSTSEINGLYIETGWNMSLSVKKSMTHKLERAIFV